MVIGAADRNRTRVCAVAPHGSAIELRTRAQSRTRTCGARRHLIYSQASLPLEYLCVVLRMARATSRSPALVFGGRLTVRTPHLAVPTRFQDGLPATPAEPSVFLDVPARFERATSAFGRRRSCPSELRDEVRPRAARPSRGSPSSSRADNRVETRAWLPAAH